MTGDGADVDGTEHGDGSAAVALDADAFLVALRLSGSFLPLGTHTASWP